jgi:nitrite reductase (NO-forming)
MKPLHINYIQFSLLVLMVTGCSSQPPVRAQDDYEKSFTLQTIIDGQMVFQGVDGEIDGMHNPDLIVQLGDSVQITLINGDCIPHDLVIPDLAVYLPNVSREGDQEKTSFTVEKVEPGEYDYYCSVAGHRQMGMQGKMIVLEP